MTDREAHTPSVGGHCDSEIYLQCSCGWEEFSSSSKTWDEHLIAAGVTLAPSLDEGLLRDGIEAFRLTRDYVGHDLLPDLPGWSWADWVHRAEHRLALRGRTP